MRAAQGIDRPEVKQANVNTGREIQDLFIAVAVVGSGGGSRLPGRVVGL